MNNNKINVKNYSFYYALRELPFIEEIILFGSRAKDMHTERSDIDLAVKCPKATKEEWRKVIDIINNSDTLLKIDCIRLDTLEDSALLKQIENNKIILFKRVKNNYNWYELFLSLGEALEKFENALSIGLRSYPYAIEATIQIFEYSFELYWKLLQKICRQEGIETNSPRSTLQQAYSMNLIDNEQAWLDMIEARNLTSHTYKQPTANTVYKLCSQYNKLMQDNYLKLKKKFGL